jgi:hypothetical protein
MSQWMGGMAGAGLAMSPPVPIQFCMATPYELMESTKHPTVTNFRASNDFFYGSSFNIGASSLLIWALGAAPSKVRPRRAAPPLRTALAAARKALLEKSPRLFLLGN